MHHTKLLATLAIATAFALAACGGTSAPEPEAAVPTTAPVAQAPTDAPAPAQPTEEAAEPTAAIEPTEEAATPAAPAAAAIPDGWTAYQSTDANFSLALPEGWDELAMDDKLLDASMDSVKDQNPELAEMMSGQARALIQSGVKFFGFNSDADAVARGFATNVNVISQDLPVSGISLDQVVEASMSQLDQLPGASKPTTEKVTLGNGLEAVKVNYGFDITTQTGDATKTATTQYITLQDKTLYIMTFSTIEDQASDYNDTFSQIAQTFTLAE